MDRCSPVDFLTILLFIPRSRSLFLSTQALGSALVLGSAYRLALYGIPSGSRPYMFSVRSSEPTNRLVAYPSG